MRRAVAYKSLTRYVQAKQDLEMVLEKEPNNRQALVSILQCLFFFFFLSFLFGVAHAPFACQRWGLPHRLAQCATRGKGLVCVVCSCCATSPYREVCRAKGGIRSGPAQLITIVSLAANTYCMMDGHSSCAPRTVGPMVQISGACEQSHWWPARHTAGGHLLSVVQAATNTERL